MKKRLILTLVLASFAVSVGAYYELRPSQHPVRFETARVSRGDLVAAVACTGTLQAVKTVDVGTQANGVIKELNADFNSIVRRGEVLARLDPAMVEAEIAQGRATVERSKDTVEQLRVTQDEANRELARAEALHAKSLLDDSDFETVRVAAAQAAADVEAAEADVSQAQASVDQNVANLEHTVITSPIDGIVIARNVDVGQTVVSNMQAQTLYQIAEDLTKLQLNADVDESDVGRLRDGDPVTFTVDAYPGDVFQGTVEQVRLNPTIDQDVVSYITVVDVPNPTLKLRPGMTANVSIRTDARSDVLSVPSTALRFKPNVELFQALHQPVPAAVRAEDGAASRDAAAGSIRAATNRAMSRRDKSGPGHVWVLRGGQLQEVDVQPGLSDGTHTEVTSARLAPGDIVVTNAITQ